MNFYRYVFWGLEAFKDTIETNIYTISGFVGWGLFHYGKEDDYYTYGEEEDDYEYEILGIQIILITSLILVTLFYLIIHLPAFACLLRLKIEAFTHFYQPIGGYFPLQANDPLSVERKYETRFETISFFRLMPEAFLIERALQEYHREPIAYALALAELNTEVFKATRERNPHAVTSYIRKSSLARRSRDVVGNGSDDLLVGLSLLQIFRYGKTIFSKILSSELSFSIETEAPKAPDNESLNAWEKRFKYFVENINLFCQHTGSEVDDLAWPQETINNLRKFTSDRRQELAPLLEVNARLNKELISYKRINAALQTRHTIEKLTSALPDTAQYDFPGSGPKWQVLWNQIWADAGQNVDNPFHSLWDQSTGEYARNNIRDKGRNLFADMSGEIHGYDQRRRNTLDYEHFDYEHFDVSARKVAMILHEKPIVVQKTGDVDWAQEIRKYPIAWPDANNLALTLLQRLEGEVVNLQRRLDVAKENVAKEERNREGDHEKLGQRTKDREANDNAQDNSEEDAGLNTLFDDEE